MRKPLILLVDDDRSVLAALEAALRPAFEAICRIEACETGEEALDALPRWQEERRPVAVAIVDQKMPGMTGVELIGEGLTTWREGELMLRSSNRSTTSRSRPLPRPRRVRSTR